MERFGYCKLNNDKVGNVFLEARTFIVIRDPRNVEKTTLMLQYPLAELTSKGK